MFTIKQPDSFALQIAESIKHTGNDMKESFSKSLVAGFNALFYDDKQPRSKEEVRRILAAFERPSDIFKHHQLAVEFLSSIDSLDLAPEEYTPPFTCLINDADGSVTIPD